jgi:hypothetical protein
MRCSDPAGSHGGRRGAPSAASPVAGQPGREPVPGLSGRHLCLEVNCSDQAADNTGPIAALLYGFSILYCMTTSLAEGGEGLGTLGLPEPVLRQLAGKAGFAQVRYVEMDNPFNRLYELSR